MCNFLTVGDTEGEEVLALLLRWNMWCLGETYHFSIKIFSTEVGLSNYLFIPFSWVCTRAQYTLN
jgi:hypothetical protein